ncbi:hypothetical protein IMZ17_12995 [Geobacillus stearothermophilus]|nr:hypothetical protein IMZ17_12995 [Geobacillus stearothermophilus]
MYSGGGGFAKSNLPLCAFTGLAGGKDMPKIDNLEFKVEKGRKNYYHINITFAGWTV